MGGRGPARKAGGPHLNLFLLLHLFGRGQPYGSFAELREDTQASLLEHAGLCRGLTAPGPTEELQASPCTNGGTRRSSSRAPPPARPSPRVLRGSTSRTPLFYVKWFQFTDITTIAHVHLRHFINIFSCVSIFQATGGVAGVLRNRILD